MDRERLLNALKLLKPLKPFSPKLLLRLSPEIPLAMCLSSLPGRLPTVSAKKTPPLWPVRDESTSAFKFRLSVPGLETDIPSASEFVVRNSVLMLEAQLDRLFPLGVQRVSERARQL